MLFINYHICEQKLHILHTFCFCISRSTPQMCRLDYRFHVNLNGLICMSDSWSVKVVFCVLLESPDTLSSAEKMDTNVVGDVINVFTCTEPQVKAMNLQLEKWRFPETRKKKKKRSGGFMFLQCIKIIVLLTCCRICTVCGLISASNSWHTDES